MPNTPENHRGDHTSEEKAAEGWQPPKTDVEVSKRFFDKHGDNIHTRAIDAKWRSLGRKIAKGSYIHMGTLQSRFKTKRDAE